MKRWLAMATAALLALPALAVGGEQHWTTDDGRQVIVIDEGADLSARGQGGYLGVTLGDLDDGDEGGAAGKGVRLRSVFADTPAAAAGLQAGDIVVEFAGKAVADAADLSAKVRAHKPGDTVKLKAERDGKVKTYEVTLGEREGAQLLGEGGLRDLRFGSEHLNWIHAFGDQGGGRLGVEVRDLEGPLAAYFPGATSGALVLDVNEESPAAKAGLEPGDVIVGLGGATVSDADDLREAVGALAGEDPGELAYLRQGKRRSTTVTIPESDMNVFFKGFADEGPQRQRIIRRLEGARGDLEQKLERLEERLEQLEKQLKKDGQRRG